MNRFSDDHDQSDHHFAPLKADDFSPERLHYRREWYVDRNVGYWLGEQGLVRAGEQSDHETPFPRIFDNRE